VQRHHRDPADGQFEDGIELQVADTRTGTTQEHDTGSGRLHDVDPFEILIQWAFVDDQATCTPVVLPQVACGTPHRGQDHRGLDFHPGTGQQLGDLAP
jgi:hypothetical protein